MIGEVGESLLKEGHSDDQKIVGKILLIVVDYINKII
jgi:hypothetical protein